MASQRWAGLGDRVMRDMRGDDFSGEAKQVRACPAYAASIIRLAAIWGSQH